jgi:DNA repair protein RadC
LDEARNLAAQSLKILEAIPPELGRQLEKQLMTSGNHVIERQIGETLGHISRIPRHETGALGIAPPLRNRQAERRAGARRLFQEIDSHPKPRVIPPGPDRPGYVKELVMKYKLRPIPYGDQLAGGYIRSSADVLKLFKNLCYEPKEHIFTVHLNGSNKILSVNHVATGSMSECGVRLGEIFRDAFLAGATGLIFLHNHPGGGIQPSSVDRLLLDELRRVATLLRITLLDFVIIGDRVHWSASDHGLLYQVGIQSYPPPPVLRRPAAGAVKGRRRRG